MTRWALRGLILALALLPAGAEAWSGSGRLSSPFAEPPLGALQNEAWGRLGVYQYFRANPPRQHVPHHPKFVWIDPSWQWNGFQWVWVPGYWVPRP